MYLLPPIAYITPKSSYVQPPRGSPGLVYAEVGTGGIRLHRHAQPPQDVRVEYSVLNHQT